jgi:hypothetical protein
VWCKKENLDILQLKPPLCETLCYEDKKTNYRLEKTLENLTSGIYTDLSELGEANVLILDYGKSHSKAYIYWM